MQNQNETTVKLNDVKKSTVVSLKTVRKAYERPLNSEEEGVELTVSGRIAGMRTKQTKGNSLVEFDLIIDRANEPVQVIPCKVFNDAANDYFESLAAVKKAGSLLEVEGVVNKYTFQPDTEEGKEQPDEVTLSSLLVTFD